MSRPERALVDLDDPEQFAEAAMLGAVEAFAVTTEQLARLGRAHTELLAAVRGRADDAQLVAMELDAAQIELAIERKINQGLRSLITSGRLRGLDGPPELTGPEASELLLTAAHALAPDRHAVIGLLLSACVNACLLAEHPHGALGAGVDVFEGALAALARQIAADAPASGAPS